MVSSQVGTGNWDAVRRDFTGKMLFVAIFGTFGSMTFAFDVGWWGSALGHPAFTNYYGQLTKANGTHALSPTQQSCGTALGTAGTMIGCMIASWSARALGRKRSFLLLAVIALMGSTVQLTSVLGDRSGPNKFWQLVVGKILVNASVGIATTVVPPYLSEVSPTSIRAFMVTFHSLAEGVGGILANATVYGLQKRTDMLPWMLPIGLQMVIPVLMIISSVLLPESPRWLIEMGRKEDAIKSIERLRTGGAEAAREEVAALEDAIHHHEQLTGGTSWVHLFRGSNARRTMITVAMTCLQQGMGISMVNNYLVVTLLNIGVTNPIQIALILGCCQFVVMLTVMSFAPDRFGRRPMLMLGAFLMGSALFVVGSISAATNNAPPPVMQRTTIGMFFVWALSFSTSWGPLSWTTMAETPSAALREKSMGLGAWAGFGVGMTVNFVQPYISAAIGARSAFVYASIAPFSIAFTYFLIPEFKGRSLEQIDEMFDAKVPARKFATYQCRTDLSDAAHRQVEADKLGSDEKRPSMDQIETAEMVQSV